MCALVCSKATELVRRVGGSCSTGWLVATFWLAHSTFCDDGDALLRLSLCMCRPEQSRTHPRRIVLIERVETAAPWRRSAPCLVSAALGTAAQVLSKSIETCPLVAFAIEQPNVTELFATTPGSLGHPFHSLLGLRFGDKFWNAILLLVQSNLAPSQVHPRRAFGTEETGWDVFHFACGHRICAGSAAASAGWRALGSCRCQKALNAARASSPRPLHQQAAASPLTIAKSRWKRGGSSS